jgi:hypothetical protein
MAEEAIEMKRYWRMAMRWGNQGSDRFPSCRARGIAAIDYWGDDGERIVSDCRKLTPDQFEQIWRRKWPQGTTPRASMRHIWLDMKKNDVIYAKTGKQVVGRGIVVGEYEYDPNILRERGGKQDWAHFVRVRWEPDFVPFECEFDAVQCTILELTGERLSKLRHAEKVAHEPVPNARGSVSDIEGLRTGAVRLTSKRSRRLREMALAQAHGVCCVCDRDFSKLLDGRAVRVLQVHHKQQISALKVPRRTSLDDLAVVCANCHMLLHLDAANPLRIQQLRKMLQTDG